MAKRRKPTTLHIGSYSTGTMRPEDLIPTFLDALDELRLTRGERKQIADIRKVSDAADEDADYWQEDASDDLDTLFDLLNNHCPDYCTFGSHPGDGADYGCWPLLDSIEEDGVERGEQLPTANTHAAPMFLQVSDHGNATLYRRAGSRWIEVWSVV